MCSFRFPPVSGKVWLDYLNCFNAQDGDNWRSCDYAPIGENVCAHSQDVIISCLRGSYRANVLVGQVELLYPSA